MSVAVPLLRDGVTLVLGGARSGKSAFAERLVEASGRQAVYVATAQSFEAGDAEMEERIALHRRRRGESWITVEAPLDLAGALAEQAGEGRAILVDCLTLWLTNLMLAGRDVAAEFARLMRALSGPVPSPVVLVSNEVGLGIVPENRMAREFRDGAGRLHQEIAAMAAAVYFVAAGLPLQMKG